MHGRAADAARLMFMLLVQVPERADEAEGALDEEESHVHSIRHEFGLGGVLLLHGFLLGQAELL